MKNPFNKLPAIFTSNIGKDLDYENRLNRYRFAQYIPEFQKLLKDVYIKKALGAVAASKILQLSQQLAPAVNSGGILQITDSNTEKVTIPIWFADESIKVDYFPEISKDPLIHEALTTHLSDELIEKMQSICIKEYTFGYTQPSGITLEHNGQPLVIIFSGLFGASMSSTLCHELVHSWQIIDRRFDKEDIDDDNMASGELEAYHYQALFEKGLQQRGVADYSIYGISGLAQKINFIRACHAKSTEPYKVTPRMKRELVARGLGSAVFPSLRVDTVEKTD